MSRPNIVLHLTLLIYGNTRFKLQKAHTKRL